MLIIPVVNAAVSAVTAVLALSSARNMIQTVQLSRANQNSIPTSTSAAVSLPQILQAHLKSDVELTAETVVEELQTLKRKELFEIYFGSRAPRDLSEIEGEWNGILLDNNGWVMVRDCLTIYLFLSAGNVDIVFGR